MAQKKYSTYQSLLVALRKNGFAKPGRLSTFLLDVFLNENREIRAPEVYRLGLCSEEKKEFREWRKELCDKGWLKFTIDQHRMTTISYRAGHKIIPYINREKIAKKEIATMDDVDLATKNLATKDEVEKLRHEMNLMKETVRGLIDEYDPPVTEEKIEHRINLVRSNVH